MKTVEMTEATPKTSRKASGKKADAYSLDVRLVLESVEKELLAGAPSEKTRRVLSDQRMWKQAAADIQVRWADLAQAAGEMDAALSVFSHMNRHAPERTEAWQRRLELLFLLDRKKELASVMASARNHVAASVVSDWKKEFALAGSQEDDNAMADARAPFDRLQEHRAAISRYMSLFSGREDCFARQWADRNDGKQGYVPERRPLQSRDVEAHLGGRKTYGIYLLRADATVTTGVIDIDLKPRFRQKPLPAADKRLAGQERNYVLDRFREMSKEAGFKPIVEFSGNKGYHLWFPVDPPIAAGAMQDLLQPLVDRVRRDVTAFSFEVFPKQRSLSGKGLGNLVKLPLGVHRLSGKRSYFPECEDRSTEAQLKFIVDFQPADAHKLVAAATGPPSARVVDHPKRTKGTDRFPELRVLETRCPPLSKIISSCRAGSEPSLREEKILYQTIGLLPDAKKLMHYLYSSTSDFNPHRVDYRLSRVRGSPMGCKRIHSLTGFFGERCLFEGDRPYDHPLLYLEQWSDEEGGRAEKIENLASALENLKDAVQLVERFMK